MSSRRRFPKKVSARMAMASYSWRQKRARITLIILAVVATVTLTIAHESPALLESTTTSRKIALPQAASPIVAPQRDHVERARLVPAVRLMLEPLGDRLAKPGSERLLMNGILNVAESQNLACQLILEMPQKVRIETPQGVVAFDGQSISTTKQSLSALDEKLLDTLAFDTADRFFLAQTNGVATRFLGSRFRLDDGSDPNYTGSYYEVYQVEEQIAVRKPSDKASKRYYFDSATLLLGRVRYQADIGNETGNVEVVLGQWQRAINQNVARRIERYENGTPVFTLTITSATVGPRVNDGVFGSR